jgi:hypothetical protein
MGGRFICVIDIQKLIRHRSVYCEYEISSSSNSETCSVELDFSQDLAFGIKIIFIKSSRATSRVIWLKITDVSGAKLSVHNQVCCRSFLTS